MRTRVFFVLVSLTAAVSVQITFTGPVEFSGFAAGLAKATMGMLLFVLFDRYVLWGIDTVEELKKGNTAYAIFLLSVAVLLAACIAVG
jgi:hypothetical protein